MKLFDMESFYDIIGKINGWDFSNVKSTYSGVSWDFYEEVKKKGEKTDVLLDIGTGGGENILKIASSFFFLIGIDVSNGMIETAQSNLENANVPNVKFFQMSSSDLQFPRGFFDIVSSRHAPFSSFEVHKVLKKGGWFLTQQVSEGDKQNLKEAFGRGQAYGQRDGALKEQYIQELHEAGFTEITSFEYDATEYLERMEDLLFLLKHTPIIPHFGKDEKDFDTLQTFVKNNYNTKGIRTNSKRFLIIAKK